MSVLGGSGINGKCPCYNHLISGQYTPLTANSTPAHHFSMWHRSTGLDILHDSLEPVMNKDSTNRIKGRELTKKIKGRPINKINNHPNYDNAHN